MRAPPIVEVKISTQLGHPLGGVDERPGIGPFGEERPHQPLGLAVGLRAIGTGAPMADAQLGAALPERVAAVGVPVVGQHPLDMDAMTVVEAAGALEEAD